MFVRPGLLLRKNVHYIYQIIKCSLHFFNIYRCTVHFYIYKVHTPTNALFIKLDKLLKCTLKITFTCSYMFRSMTIIREPSLQLQTTNYVVIRYAVVWQHAATPPHNI